jgi:cell division protein FtsW (lipid II flippase)
MHARLVAPVWPNLPDSYAPSLGSLGIETAVVALVTLYFVGHILFLYWWDAFIERAELPPDRMRRWEAARWVFTAPAKLVKQLAVDRFPPWWGHVGSTLEQEDPETADEEVWSFRRIITVLAVAVVGILIVSFAAMWWFGRTKWYQEVLAPLLLCWVPAVFWLSSRLRFGSGSEIMVLRRKRAVTVAVITVLIPVFFLPVAVRDPGGLVATMAVFFPLVAVLFIGRRPRHMAGYVSCTLAIALVAALLLYLSLPSSLPAVKWAGAAGSRLLLFKERPEILGGLLFFPEREDPDEMYSVTAWSLRQGLQHTWENRAIAHEGGIRGLGYGNAPTRRSHIRQDTLQFDSTFSFFIVAEYGVLGGVALVLLYAAPLVLVAISGRAFFGIGHGLALVVTAALFLEALAHAGMNLGLFPFTGRNLPWLSVNSTSDLVRWAILLPLATQALVWRATGGKHGFLGRSIASPPEALAPPAVIQLEPRKRYWSSILKFVATPAVIGTALLTWTAVEVFRDRGIPNALDWSELYATVRDLVRSDNIQVRDDLQLVADPLARSKGGTLLEQEIARFNALTTAEKLGEAVYADPSGFLALMRQVHSLGQYDAAMSALRDRDEGLERRRPPSLFLLVPDREPSDPYAGPERLGPRYRVTHNASFISQTSFKSAPTREDFPEVWMRGGATGAYLIRGHDFELIIPDRPPRNKESRRILLEEVTAGRLRLTEDTNPDGARGVVRVKYRPPGSAVQMTITIGEIGGSSAPAGTLPFRARRPAKLVAGALTAEVAAGTTVMLTPGDALEFPEPGAPERRIWFRLHRSSRGAAIGPARVAGRWRLVYDPDPLLPWTALLHDVVTREWSRLGRDETIKRYGALTLDRTLQQAAQEFVAEKGRRLHSKLIGAYREASQRRPEIPAGIIPLEVLPPRIALSILNATTGEVLALGGWPRMTSDRVWSTNDGEVVPPVEWVEQSAPASIRLRYGGDRNFDRLVMGSASKPIWAAAVLAVHPGLDQKLSVSGDKKPENDVFGIRLQRPWEVGRPSASLADGRWCDFSSYLARSDNRYQVRLGFLGLAEPSPNSRFGIAEEPTPSPSMKESLDGGQTVWRRFPRFPSDIRFSRTALSVSARKRGNLNQPSWRS